MTKKLMIGAAIGALLVAGAQAQSPTAPSSSSSAPPAAAPAPPAAAKSNGDKPNFVTSQKPDQLLASKFKGTNVMSSDNQKIGDVSDILFDKDGKIEAYVITMGGFLGMGGKEIALAPSSFEVIPGKNGASDILKLSMKQEEFKQAQNFKPYSPPHATTTGSGGGLGRLPSSSGMRPSTNTPPTSR